VNRIPAADAPERSPCGSVVGNTVQITIDAEAIQD